LRPMHHTKPHKREALDAHDPAELWSLHRLPNRVSGGALAVAASTHPEGARPCPRHAAHRGRRVWAGPLPLPQMRRAPLAPQLIQDEPLRVARLGTNPAHLSRLGGGWGEGPRGSTIAHPLASLTPDPAAYGPSAETPRLAHLGPPSGSTGVVGGSRGGAFPRITCSWVPSPARARAPRPSHPRPSSAPTLLAQGGATARAAALRLSQFSMPKSLVVEQVALAQVGGWSTALAQARACRPLPPILRHRWKQQLPLHCSERRCCSWR